MEDLLTALRAAGETTRLRALVALRSTELTVGDLCRVLEQSQPRVSRHCKLLLDAGLVQRAAESTSAFYRLTEDPVWRPLIDELLARVDLADPQVIADDGRVADVRAERAAAALDYFEEVAAEWDAIRPLHVADEDIEQAMLAALDGRRPGRLLDIGTGTGRMLELLGPHVDEAIGIDTSAAMLRAARAHLDRSEFGHCSVRLADALELDLPASTVDLVVLHHVLHFLEDPAAAIAEVARVLAPGGLVLIVDFARHEVESLRTRFAHRHLGFSTEQMTDLCVASGLHVDRVELFRPADAQPALGVHLWQATPSLLPSP